MSDFVGEPTCESMVATENEVAFSKMDSLLAFREQPLLELCNSEESYVQRLQFVCDTYIPIVQTGPLDLLPHSPVPTVQRIPATAATHAPSGAPQPPPDLAAKWRILWGNWYQLTEWHTQFSEKLKVLLHSQPDAIPELFLSSCSRMRSMYMKYCENHLKAIALVAQHKTYFEELRMYFFDRDDILSHLMQPIQRVTRYQLPMIQALKIMERANSPSREIWREAVTLLKDIPNDVQMIMEAAKIVGFSGSITNLGHLRLFSAMYVARISSKEMHTALSAAKLQDQYQQEERQSEESRLPESNSAKSQTWLSPSRSPSSPDQQECEFCRKLSKVRRKARKALHLKFFECRVFLFDQSLLITDDEASTEPGSAGRSMNRFVGDFGRVVRGSRSFTYSLADSPSERGASPQSPLPTWPSKGSCETMYSRCAAKSHAVRATSVSRVISSSSVGSDTRTTSARSAFHLRRHTSAIHTEPEHHRTMLAPTSPITGITPSTPTLNDPFRQSSYTFQHAIKVNRMSFMPHWLASELSVRNLFSESFLFDAATDESNSFLRRQRNLQKLSKLRFIGYSFPESDKEMQDSESPDGTETIYEVEPLHAERVAGEDKSSLLSSPLLADSVCSCPSYVLSTSDNADRLWFAVADESPGSDAVFIFDPGSPPVRDVWLTELKDIQQMQADIQLALQNPKRFLATIRQQPHSMVSLTGSIYEHKPRLKYQSSTLELRSHASPQPFCSLDKNHLDPRPLHIRGISAPTMAIKKEESLEEITKIKAINFANPQKTALSEDVSWGCSSPGTLRSQGSDGQNEDVFFPQSGPASPKTPHSFFPDGRRRPPSADTTLAKDYSVEHRYHHQVLSTQFSRTVDISDSLRWTGNSLPTTPLTELEETQNGACISHFASSDVEQPKSQTPSDDPNGPTKCVSSSTAKRSFRSRLFRWSTLTGRHRIGHSSTSSASGETSPSPLPLSTALEEKWPCPASPSSAETPHFKRPLRFRLSFRSARS